MDLNTLSVTVNSQQSTVNSQQSTVNSHSTLNQLTANNSSCYY
ncbi:hypothetical protein [Tychonema sp. LEGE 07203]|nr:hypothetical protein [Tychonema sp. LEGE 07203]